MTGRLDAESETVIGVKLPITHWITVIGIVVAVTGNILYTQFQVSQANKDHDDLVASTKLANERRQQLIDSHEKILSDLTRIADRFGIKLDRAETDLRDIESRVRMTESRLDRSEARKLP